MANSHPLCDYTPGSDACLGVKWGHRPNLCRVCPWWDAYVMEIMEEAPE